MPVEAMPYYLTNILRLDGMIYGTGITYPSRIVVKFDHCYGSHFYAMPPIEGPQFRLSHGGIF